MLQKPEGETQNHDDKKPAIISLSRGSYCTHRHKQQPRRKRRGIKPSARIKTFFIIILYICAIGQLLSRAQRITLLSRA